MAAVLPDPFYYLENFRQVLDWVGARHADLLDDQEHGLIARIEALPRPAQALLVRMVMRKGELFRQGKLVYAEIGDVASLLPLLATQELIDTTPVLSPPELFSQLRKDELLPLFGKKAEGAFKSSARKEDMLALLAERYPDARPLAQWRPGFEDTVCRLLHADVYDRLRLLYFGNLHQDWSEFVLTDLGLLKYEPVEIPADARAFQARADVDDYLQLHELRTRLDAGEAPLQVLADIPGECAKAHFANAWLEERRSRLLFHIGQQLEREKEWSVALAAYQASSWPEARLRAIRVLEQDAQPAQALELAMTVLQSAPREEERQQLARVLPRLRRKLGLSNAPAETLLAPERCDLVLDFDEGISVEMQVRDHLHADAAPVFYVENALINSLFGLLCWPAIFAPVPGAFFHAFHYGPVDLHSPGFHSRREAPFAQCLGLLDSDAYHGAILSTWRAKHGTQSPFVFWDWLNEDLLMMALACIPATHLKALFTRLLADIKNNRSGFPDLIRFWPAEERYLMLEVKGPGDRLQDNQVRWLDYCIRHGIPVAVSHVTWAGALVHPEPPAMPSGNDA
ncbi:MAG: hypothetical protein K0Q68_2397 [Moraxellaceae bacterium]|jgi:hypothetical protein|nr:hypothetical protein [Moraxellaceae bacterium]